jgi:F-type H+-transporting ATPase subunit b
LKGENALELSWTTFLLEILNFLVLIWILKRFLFAPVQRIVARRQDAIERRIGEAQQQQAEAGRLQQQFESRLADWEQEKRQARDALNLELEAERSRRMTELQSQLAEAREKARAADQRQQADTLQRLEARALTLGAGFAGRVLAAGACAESEARLIDFAIDELERLPAAQAEALRSAHAALAEAGVASAYPIPADRRERLERACKALLGPTLQLRYMQQPELLAGLRITLGAWVLGLNLEDELAGFVSLQHGKADK